MSVERFEREVAVEVEKTQELLAARSERSQAASCPLAEDGDSFQDLQFKIATATTEMKKSRKLAYRTAVELKVAHADVVLQSPLREAV